MNAFLSGGIAIGTFAAGLFFFQYWRSSRDRFFLFLMASFWIEIIACCGKGWMSCGRRSQSSTSSRASTWANIAAASCSWRTTSSKPCSA